uniref:Protein kinase domain-containing protein n=1 Tax=Eutreptiella gymnastica TaxID=73025 RepID=A0A7S1JGJ2_9EUGL|mmetsp:Transcript_95121/g.164211  ORF Transcript_95121/g.164211 Transcript_95121/m.164211 type:complete len:407 (+) Transcript_95121:279-1499(+)
MHKYRLLGKKGEGTFSEVLKAQCTKNGKYVAIKCMKNHFDSVEQVNRLREIQALRRLSPHPNIIKLYEILYDRSTGRLALVFELMDMNIYELIRGRRQYVAEDKILHFMYQLVKAMDHMHRNGIFHRDIKPENILICGDTLKLADFGSCRGIYSKQPFTEYISTRWYRAPECLLTDGYYNYKMDMWGVGCVFFEIVSLYPLFPGTNELDQIHKIHNILGTPSPDLLNKMKKHSSHIEFEFPQKQGTGLVKLIPHASQDALDLMQKLLAYNPEDRISAKQALRHAYFKEIRELDKKLRAKAKQQQQGSADGDPTSAPATAQSDSDSLGGTVPYNATEKEKDGYTSTLPSIATNGSSVTQGHKEEREKEKVSTSLPTLPVYNKPSTLPSVDAKLDDVSHEEDEEEDMP